MDRCCRNIHGKTLQKVGVCLVMLNESQRCRSTGILTDEDDVGWAANPLCMYQKV